MAALRLIEKMAIYEIDKQAYTFPQTNSGSNDFMKNSCLRKYLFIFKCGYINVKSL